MDSSHNGEEQRDLKSQGAKKHVKEEIESEVRSISRNGVGRTDQPATGSVDEHEPRASSSTPKSISLINGTTTNNVEQQNVKEPEVVAIVQNVKAEAGVNNVEVPIPEPEAVIADDNLRLALEAEGPQCGQEEQVRSSRMMRNLAEKMRRDKLNMYISELSSLVPIVAMATKRMDKTSVLRLSANFLRIHLSLKQPNPRPPCAPAGLEDFLSSAVLDAIEGFMLIVSTSGKIVYISDSIEKLLGHSQMDLMGQSLYTICHNGDHELLRHHLQPSRPFEAREGESTDNVDDFVPRSPSFFGGAPDETLNGLASGERRSFYVRLAERSMARGDPARHVTVHLIGYLRQPDTAKKDTASKNSKGKKESTSTVEEPMLVCVARPFRNKGITELSLMEAVQDEYVTRHLPDGRIIYSDHRIAFVAGYLTEEVMGLSAFNFIHHDDRPWATVANRQMFSSVEGQGYSVYRLRSKTGDLIHLRTRGFLEFNKTTQKVETFVCINTLLTSEEGDKELEKERERITPFITFQQVTTTSSTNMSAAAGSSAQSASPSTSPAILPDNHQLSMLPITSKVVHTTFKLSKIRGDASSSLMSNSSPATITCASSALGIAPRISSLGESTSGVMIEELPADDPGCSNDSILSSATSDLIGSGEWHVNGNGMKTINHNSLKLLRGNTSTISSPQSTPNMGLMDLTDAYINVGDQNVETAIQQTPTSAILSSTIKHSDSQIAETPGNLLPRLKRSFAEVEDLVVTPSAKRPIQSAFIYSHSSLHPSHLGSKWGTETSTTLLFDQHNNNG